MANLRNIQRRINSVNSTRKITSTMQMISAAKVGRTAARLQRGVPYSQALSQIMQNLLNEGSNLPQAYVKEHKEIRNSLIICVVSDKGLAGGFNSNILKMAQTIINDNNNKNVTTHVIAHGKKAIGYFKFRNIDTVLQFEGTSDYPKLEDASTIANWAIDNFSSGNIDEVHLLYNKSKNSMEQTPTSFKLLPVNPDELVNSNSEQMFKKGEVEIMYKPSREAILQNLFPLLINNKIFNALLDSAAGEQVARRVAMQNATDSANDMIDTLTRLYNSVRQGAITTELNEIVGGAEALAE